MRICEKHWQICWDTVKERGLSGLVAADPEAALSKLTQNDIEENPDSFDPLISMHWHFTNHALKFGGLYLLGTNAEGQPYCPICEFERNAKGFVAEQAIDDVAEQMAAGRARSP
jgi:hypothetical protein